MDFKQIEAFVSVIKHKGFSRAAEATFLTQPTISSHIHALEKELQLQLIERTKKEALPTREGKLFYNYALSMIHTREQAVYSLQNFALNMNGTVEIQASSIPGEYIVPGLFSAFKKEYQGARFLLEQSDSFRVCDHIKAGKGEIGFTGQKKNNGLVYDLLMKDKAVLIAPDNEYYRSKAAVSVQLSDFLTEPFILRERGSATREILERELADKGVAVSSIHAVAQMNSMEAIKQAIRGGLGVSVISEAAAQRERKDNGYLVFDLKDSRLERNFYMVYNDRITMSPTAETFKLFVLEKHGGSFRPILRQEVSIEADLLR